MARLQPSNYSVQNSHSLDNDITQTKSVSCSHGNSCYGNASNMAKKPKYRPYRAKKG